MLLTLKYFKFYLKKTFNGKRVNLSQQKLIIDVFFPVECQSEIWRAAAAVFSQPLFNVNTLVKEYIGEKLAPVETLTIWNDSIRKIETIKNYSYNLSFARSFRSPSLSKRFNGKVFFLQWKTLANEEVSKRNQSTVSMRKELEIYYCQLANQIVFLSLTLASNWCERSRNHTPEFQQKHPQLSSQSLIRKFPSCAQTVKDVTKHSINFRSIVIN